MQQRWSFDHFCVRKFHGRHSSFFSFEPLYFTSSFLIGEEVYSLRLQLSERLFPELRRLLTTAKVILPSETFVHLLEQHPYAAAWGENPLLFSLAAVIILQTGRLPSCRAALYHDVVEAVLQTREQDPLWGNLLMRMLTKLALWLHQSKGRTFTRTDLLTFFSEVQEKSLAETAELARRIISSGIIEVVARDTYSFRHQTFQEYLAAAELAYLLTDQKPQICKDGWRLTWSKRTYSRWTEVLRLMVGVLVQTRGKKGREAAHRWLRALLEQRATEEGDPGNLGLMLALKSLAEASEISGWETSHTSALEKDIITTWVNELRFAIAHHRNAQKESLARLSYDMSHLRKPLLEQTLKQLLTKGTGKEDSEVASAALRKQILKQALAKGTGKEDSEVASAVLQFLGEQIPLEPLLGALRHEIPEVRAKEDSEVASAVLQFLGEQIPLEPLLGALRHEIPEVRAAAMQVLAKQGKCVPIEVLISALGDESEKVWKAAVKALGAQGERVPIDVLSSVLKDWQNIAWQIVETDRQIDKNKGMESPTVSLRTYRERTMGKPEIWLDAELRNQWQITTINRQAIVEMLGAQGEQVPIEVLISALKDESQKVRKTVIEVLGAQGEQVPIEVLVSALKDESKEVREVVLKVLNDQKERMTIEMLLTNLHDEKEYIREAAVKALEIQGERAPIEVLISALKDKSWLVREAAANALRVQGERVPLEVFLETLISAGRLEDRLLRERIADSLINIGTQIPVIPLDILVLALQDTNENVREVITHLLGALGERVPLETLLAALKDESRLVRQAVIKTLGSQGERVPIEVLLSTLEDKDGFIREATVKALGDQGERVPIEVLLTILQSEDKFMRRAAAQSLIGQGERIPPDILMKTLEDEDRDVRRLMIRVIRKIDPEALSALPSEVLSILQRQPIGMILNSIIQGFAANTPDDLELSLQFLLKTLEQLLDWPDMLVRIRAIHVLGKIRRYIPDSTIQRLLELRRDPDLKISTAADEALAEILSLETGIEDD